MNVRNAAASLDQLTRRWEAAIATSPLVAGLRQLADTEKRLKSGRPLIARERVALENQGNVCTDWSRVRLEGDAALDNIRDNRFDGDVLLLGFAGEWTGPGNSVWPAGMSHCRVRNAVIGNACLYDIASLERQVIGDGAVLVGIGEIDCPRPTLFSFGQAIHPGTETGLRSVWIWDDMTLEDCVTASSLPVEAQQAFQKTVDAATRALTSGFGYVGPRAAVLHTRHVQGAWIGPGVLVQGATLIRESALMGAEQIPSIEPEKSPSVTAEKNPSVAAENIPTVAADDAWIEHSLLQPGARVESGGRVSRSLLMERASVAWGGMVSQSVVGSDTQVHKGELNASLVGPFVGFHHQSLLISALWPEGRGNIAYGANVGSNHTGKKPDQEIRPGEGNFFGLGSSIKFPANFEDAPYSIIATGIVTQPQRLRFPFSLVNQPHAAPADLPPGLNEIVPGWMWSDNLYSLVRRAYKFGDSERSRNPSDPASSKCQTGKLRAGFFTSRIFNHEMAAKVLRARQALCQAPSDREYYLEEQIPGMGKNFLRPKALEQALSAYSDYLCFFLLRAHADNPRSAWPGVWSPLVDAVAAELDSGPDIRLYLKSQLFRILDLGRAVTASLARDDKRGKKIFDDYADFHPSPETDGAVLRLGEDLADLSSRLNEFLAAD